MQGTRSNRPSLVFSPYEYPKVESAPPLGKLGKEERTQKKKEKKIKNKKYKNKNQIRKKKKKNEIQNP